MNQIIKQKWLDALRSKNYKQGTGALRIADMFMDRFCCLGVLCDIYSKEIGEEWEPLYSTSVNDMAYDYEFLNEVELLPKKVSKWAGLKNINPEVMWDLECSNLAMLNDQGLSFNEIAQVIEEQL